MNKPDPGVMPQTRPMVSDFDFAAVFATHPGKPFLEGGAVTGCG